MVITIKSTPKESLTIKVPHYYYERISESINNEINSVTELNDRFGFHPSTRVYKSNIASFTDKCMYIVSKIYSHLSLKDRFNGRVLCTDFSEKQLSELLGDCTRNKTKIGWKSIKNFLIENEIIDIADGMFIHDSFLNKSQSIGYTLFRMKDLKSKPQLKKSKNDRLYSSSREFSIDELEFDEYTITDRKFLKCIAKSTYLTYDDETVCGHQLELLAKYRANINDYNFVTNCISGTMEKRYLFHEDRTEKGKFGECSLLRNLSQDTVDITDFRVRQSPYSSRIFSNITSARKFARSFINFNDSENVFSEFDLKSSQIVLSAFLYNKIASNEDSLRTLEAIVTHDIYQLTADKSGKSRDEMKKLAFKSIFSKKEYNENTFTKVLSELFPKFYDFLNKQKGSSKKSKLAIKLQRLESSIFVGDYMYNFNTGLSKAKYLPECKKSKCILGELYKLGIDAFSVHDSILVNVSQAAKKFNIDKSDVWDVVIAPIVIEVFTERFFSGSFPFKKINEWVFGAIDEGDEFVTERRKNFGEMKLFSRYDDFNQFRSYTFDKISSKYGTGLHFSNYTEYRDYTVKGDFSKYMYDIPDDSFWNTHDKNDPIYEPYFKMIELENECPF